MHTVSKTRETKHSAESLWEAVAAFNQVHEWHPLVRESPGTAREDFAVGAARVCHFNDGTCVHERVTGFEQGKSIDIELSEFSMPLKEAHGRISIQPGLGGASVSLAISFRPKFGPMGDLMAAVMIKPMMGKMITQVLEGLDAHLQSPAAKAA